MAKPGENNAHHKVKLSQIFYILYGYMVKRNLESLSFTLSSKSIRDFLTWIGQCERVSCLLPSPDELNDNS